jgi:hypothetical protein
MDVICSHDAPPWNSSPCLPKRKIKFGACLSIQISICVRIIIFSGQGSYSPKAKLWRLSVDRNRSWFLAVFQNPPKTFASLFGRQSQNGVV